MRNSLPSLNALKAFESVARHLSMTLAGRVARHARRDQPAHQGTGTAAGLAPVSAKWTQAGADGIRSGLLLLDCFGFQPDA